MSTDRPHEVDAMPDEVFDVPALAAAHSLAERGCVLVELAPGDMTLYRLSIIDAHHGAIRELGPGRVRIGGGDMAGGRYQVASNFGSLYAWSGREIHWDYVLAHYVTDPKGEWTSRVLARFLTTLSRHLNGAPT